MRDDFEYSRRHDDGARRRDYYDADIQGDSKRYRGRDASSSSGRVSKRIYDVLRTFNNFSLFVSKKNIVDMVMNTEILEDLVITMTMADGEIMQTPEVARTKKN